VPNEEVTGSQKTTGEQEMKISKSKRQLAQLLIEAGVKQFPNRANFVAHDGNGAGFYSGGKPYWDSNHHEWASNAENGSCVGVHTLNGRIKNHHQTVLSRAEFDKIVAEGAEHGKPDADGWIEWKGGERPVDGSALVEVKLRNPSAGNIERIRKADEFCWNSGFGGGGEIISYRLHKPESAEPQYCESVTRTIPEPVTAPTLDQLLQDYRNAADFAATKQTEADEAAKMRDERWKDAQARACELGVRISVELVVDAEISEPEPVITDWRDVKPGDIVWIGDRVDDPDCDGAEYEVERIDERDQGQPFKLNGGLWPMINRRGWRFIRRP
jgi:hypothetical protein